MIAYDSFFDLAKENVKPNMKQIKTSLTKSLLILNYINKKDLSILKKIILNKSNDIIFLNKSHSTKKEISY